MNIYFACALVGILAMALTQVIIVGKQQKKYRMANLKWEPKVYWQGDFLVQILGSVITISIGLIILYYTFLQFPKYKDTPAFVVAFFAFIGYTGTDAATKLFSAINNRYNSAVDYKTDIADEKTGTLGTPTPAAKPIKE